MSASPDSTGISPGTARESPSRKRGVLFVRELLPPGATPTPTLPLQGRGRRGEAEGGPLTLLLPGQGGGREGGGPRSRNAAAPPTAGPPLPGKRNRQPWSERIDVTGP